MLILMVIDALVVFLADVDITLLDNDRFVVDLGPRPHPAFDVTKRESFLAGERVFVQTERGLDAAARAGNGRQETR